VNTSPAPHITYVTTMNRTGSIFSYISSSEEPPLAVGLLEMEPTHQYPLNLQVEQPVKKRDTNNGKRKEM
jgi:hypothetical protein